MCLGRVFHRRGAETLNARTPPKRSLDFGSNSLTLELKSLVSLRETCTSSIFLRYEGARPINDLNVNNTILYRILAQIGSHCSFFKTSMLLTLRVPPVIRRAAQFCSRCNLSNSTAGML